MKRKVDSLSFESTHHGFPSTIIRLGLCQTKARAASKATKKLSSMAHWLTDKAESWGVDITIWHACADSHQQSEMAAMGPNAPAYITQLAESTKHAKYSGLCTAHAWQPAPASCLEHLCQAMGAGVRRSSTSPLNYSSTACMQRSGQYLVAQSGTPLQSGSGSSCSSVKVWQL